MLRYYINMAGVSGELVDGSSSNSYTFEDRGSDSIMVKPIFDDYDKILEWKGMDACLTTYRFSKQVAKCAHER